MQTIGQLEAKLKEKVDGPFKDQVTFSDEHDAFGDVCCIPACRTCRRANYWQVAAKSIALMVRALESSCAMRALAGLAPALGRSSSSFG